MNQNPFRKQPEPITRIGIFAGTFDPVHNGHLAFARAANEQYKLDVTYFLIEAQPRRKTKVTDVKHRRNMLESALKNEPKLKVLAIGQSQFNVSQTLPELKQRFLSAELYLLVGSDVFGHLPQWPESEKLLQTMQPIVGLRQNDQPIRNTLTITTPELRTSSDLVRSEIKAQGKSSHIPKIVAAYIRKQQLYS